MFQRPGRRSERHALRRFIANLQKALVPGGILISGNFRKSFRIFKSRYNPWKSLCFSDPAAAVNDTRRIFKSRWNPWKSLRFSDPATAVNDTRSGDPSRTFKKHWSQGVFPFPETPGRVSGYLKVATTLGNPYVSVTRPPQ